MSSPTLDAGRLRLRPLCDEDAVRLHEILSDPSVYGPTSYDLLSLGQTRAVIANWLAKEKEGLARRWGITRAEDDLLLGTCGFHRIDPKHQVAELGYELAPAFWRRGFATDAVNAVTSWALTCSPIRRVEAVVWIENAASIRVLEKCSFQREGHLREFRLCRGEPRDFYLYARLRDNEAGGRR